MKTTLEPLYEVGLRVPAFESTDGLSWRGPCPKCGGHRRFLIFTDCVISRWNFKCDGCGFKGTVGNTWPEVAQHHHNDKPSHQSVTLDDRKKEEEKRLSELQASRKWLRFHARAMEDPDIVTRYQERGIPQEWISYWLLGWTDTKFYLFEREKYQSSAMTIPKIGQNEEILNIDYRLTNYKKGSGKYRHEFGIPVAPFLADTSCKEGENLYIVEGAFKAMVLYLMLEQEHGESQVVGLAGAGTHSGIAEYGKHFKNRSVILDPDAQASAEKLCKGMTNETKQVFFPTKVDDAILAKDLSYSLFKKIVKSSRTHNKTTRRFT